MTPDGGAVLSTEKLFSTITKKVPVSLLILQVVINPNNVKVIYPISDVKLFDHRGHMFQLKNQGGLKLCHFTNSVSFYQEIYTSVLVGIC